MATIELTLQTDNAAFENDPGTESARILRTAADWIEQRGESGQSHAIKDINGNTVGIISIFDFK